MTETDWKLFRKLREVALDRLCERVLSEVGELIADTSQSNHARFLAIYKLIHQRDEEIADAFNDVRRSTMIRQLACIRRLGVLIDEEFSQFSEQTRGSVGAWLGE